MRKSSKYSSASSALSLAVNQWIATWVYDILILLSDNVKLNLGSESKSSRLYTKKTVYEDWNASKLSALSEDSNTGVFPVNIAKFLRAVVFIEHSSGGCL